eukprot:6177899-Pleurochrysis_carterae.AAC.1
MISLPGTPKPQNWVPQVLARGVNTIPYHTSASKEKLLPYHTIHDNQIVASRITTRMSLLQCDDLELDVCARCSAPREETTVEGEQQRTQERRKNAEGSRRSKGPTTVKKAPSPLSCTLHQLGGTWKFFIHGTVQYRHCQQLKDAMMIS